MQNPSGALLSAVWMGERNYSREDARGREIVFASLELSRPL
jgi:hypothetical protein